MLLGRHLHGEKCNLGFFLLSRTITLFDAKVGFWTILCDLHIYVGHVSLPTEGRTQVSKSHLEQEEWLCEGWRWLRQSDVCGGKRLRGRARRGVAMTLGQRRQHFEDTKRLPERFQRHASSWTRKSLPASYVCPCLSSFWWPWSNGPAWRRCSGRGWLPSRLPGAFWVFAWKIVSNVILIFVYFSSGLSSCKQSMSINYFSSIKLTRNYSLLQL